MSAAPLISQQIAEPPDWRGKALARMRKLINQADPRSGGVEIVKLTFAKGASLKDPAGLFNSSLNGKVRRAIDIREGEEVNAAAFKALVREAVTLNRSGRSK